MTRLVLGLDQGTSSTRCVALDRDLRERGTASVAVACSFPGAGLVEQEPKAIAESARAAIAGALDGAAARSRDVAALGIANQTETFVVWERATGRAVHPAIVWQDRRTDAACAELRASGHAQVVRARTGLEFDATFPATKLRWVLDHVAGARGGRGRAARVRRRGGLAPAPPRRGARHRRRQRGPLAAVPARWRRLGRRAARPVQDPAGAAAAGGGLGPDRRDRGRGPRARRRGRPAGLAVRAALLDGREREGDARDRGLRPRAGGRGGAARAGRDPRVVRVAARGRDELRARGLHPDGRRGGRLVRPGGSAPHRGELDELLPSGREGAVCVPALQGFGSPAWDAGAGGALLGLRLGTTRADLARAVVDGVLHQVADAIEAMREAAVLDTLRLDGGLSRSDWIAQRLADLAGARVERTARHDSTALGAATLAGLAAGVWDGSDALPEIPSRLVTEPRLVPPSGHGSASAGRPRAGSRRAGDSLRRMPTPPALHELESEVMEELWNRGAGSVRDVLGALNRRTRTERAYTTVLTVMQRLHKKGLLRRAREGRKDLYVPALTREEYAQARVTAEVGAVVDEYGDVALTHFARVMSQLDPKRRAQVQRLARRG